MRNELKLRCQIYLKAIIDVNGSEHIIVESFIRDIEDIGEIHLKIKFGADFGINDIFDNKEQEQTNDRSK